MTSSFVWPSEDGWPYPDTAGELVDHDGDLDEDLLSLRAESAHLLDELDPTERLVVTARFGLDGSPVRTMKELHDELGMSRDAVRATLGSALAKLRVHFTA